MMEQAAVTEVLFGSPSNFSIDAYDISTAKYQVMPLPEPDLYESLKADISENGVHNPIEFDEDGNPLDGCTRLQACKELGIREFPYTIVPPEVCGETDAEKRAYARKQNLLRRQVSAEQKRRCIEEHIVENPRKSNRQVAKELGVSHVTVGGVRERLIAAGYDVDVDATVGADGKSRPVGTARDALQQQIQAELEAHPEKSDRQIARELGVSHVTVWDQRKKCSTGQSDQLNTSDEPYEPGTLFEQAPDEPQPAYHVTVSYEPEEPSDTPQQPYSYTPQSAPTYEPPQPTTYVTQDNPFATPSEPAKKAHVSYNSGQNEWYTPESYITAARKVMGYIDLDPASSEIANRTVKAETYYTQETDGLAHDWFGNIWMNPPYSSDKIGRFADKLADEYENYESAIVLVNNATETSWFSTMVSCASAVCFPRGRVKFLDPEGNPGAPLQGQAIIYIGEQPDMFCDVFSEFGWVATLV